MPGSAGDVLEDDPVGRLKDRRADHFFVTLMTSVHASITKKRRPLKEEFFHCYGVLPWFKHLDRGIMSIFVYFRGLFYDVGNDPEGGYYAGRGARAAVWENFKDNPLFDISTEHPTTYYEDMRELSFVCAHLDDIVLPFADAIPWEEIGVFVDEKDVPQLDTILTSIPPEVILGNKDCLPTLP
ncbi:Exostosin-like [Sesbania bispinosa]|nr:Exostosin-like [Sesbania bispinosa]